MKHRHSEVIKAFVDGVKCEFEGYAHQWYLITDLDDFKVYDKVRIKPQPSKEEEPQYFYVYNNIELNKTMMSPTSMQETYGWQYMGKVRVEK